MLGSCEAVRKEKLRSGKSLSLQKVTTFLILINEMAEEEEKEEILPCAFVSREYILIARL